MSEKNTADDKLNMATSAAEPGKPGDESASGGQENAQERAPAAEAEEAPAQHRTAAEAAVFEDQEVALEVKDLCITYNSVKRYSVKANLLRGKKREKEKVEAVKDVSFTLYKGNILGIVGRNGSGKSTMLRSIAGIFSPDSGTVDLKGHSISLMSIGVGFNNELSGRDNIILSGMLLGFSKEEIEEKMEDIIEFSELGRFIEMPVRTYSSGMHSKLAFAITAILETDIMLVDEVLSVGDAKFKKKSFNKMKSLINDKDRTVIIVSHNMSTLEELCDKILWINDGEVKMYGDKDAVLPEYEKFMS